MKTQVWIAISVYVLVALVKKELRLDNSLSEILQILSVTLFEKMPISSMFLSETLQVEKEPCHKQLTLFDL